MKVFAIIIGVFAALFGLGYFLRKRDAAQAAEDTAALKAARLASYEGQLIRDPRYLTVYLVQQGTLHPITDRQNIPSNVNVVSVSTDDVHSITLGAPVQIKASGGGGGGISFTQATGLGATVGGAVGSVIPVVGTAIGAGAGAVIGGAADLIGNLF